MHGGHSPKTLNGPGPNGTPQIKGKKREQSSDSGQLRPEDMLKAEIARITEKGGLVDYEGVEKMIQLMQPESGDKKVDLASRIMLCNVISVTESSDCLGRLVHLRGLLILDEWLQEFHKGKIGDGSPKEGDLSVEEFLFALLGALDKLPVNIHALQTCNVGKSVNHLRSHKNPEIIKKARTLVDTWKRSVEAEMNMIERKRVEQMNIIETRSGTRRQGSGSWSNKSMMGEVSPHSVKQVKVSTSQSPVLKAHQGKQSPESCSPTKVPTLVPAGTGSSDAPGVTSKEDKSSSSSPSGNNSQSSKGSPIRATPERITDAENMNNNNQRIIVRLPNMGRSPARTVSGGSLDGRASGKGDNNVVGMDTDSCKGKEGEAPKGADSAPGGTYEASYSSINALVESCAKFSEVPGGDDVGMNLLASVAAGEISRSNASSSCSRENKPPIHESTRSEDNGNSRQSIEDGCQSEDDVKVGNGHARLAENGNDGGTGVKVESHVKNECGSRSASDKHEDEKKLVKKEHDNSLEHKAERIEEKSSMDPDSSVVLQTGENEAREGDDSKSVPVSEMTVKLDFDLNEVDPSDEIENSPVIGSRPTASVTVAAAAKGPFLSSENLLKSNKSDVGFGWKGSAATSAFRPAEPRKPREFLDFDLNVGAVDDNPPSKYVDTRNSGGGLDLNLNACEETPDVGPLAVSFSNIPPRSLLSGGFDLNNGPGVEENGGVESISLSRNAMQFLPNVGNVRMGNMDVGSFQSWFPPPNTTYPAQSYPMPQRMLTPMPAGGTATPFNPEIFRGPVLSSSPAVAFQFPGFPFETNFSMPSNTLPTAYVTSSGGPLVYPTIPSQMVGPAYRPYIMSLPGGSSDNRKWGGHGLDLNSGPDHDTSLRQLPLADEQLKMFQQMAAASGSVSGGVLKRKEPVDGWDGVDRITYKHPSWQ